MSKRHTDIGAVSPIPGGYTQLNYIQSSGTQYIDTGVLSGQKTNVILDITPTNLSGGIFIGWMSPNNNYCRSYVSCTNNRFSFGYGDGYDSGYYNTSIGNVNARFLLEYQTFSEHHWLKINDADVFQSSAATTYINTLSFTIFARHLDSNVNAFSKAKLHEVSIAIDDVLKYHAIPVLRLSDNKPGLWDFVSQRFFVNAGTGEFQYA